MDGFLNMLHPPGWSIWQTMGTGAILTIGCMIGRFVVDTVASAASRARK